MVRFVFSLALLCCDAIAIGEDCRSCKCDHCGCQSQCRKVCRLVCEMKEVKETHYCCKCEDFCVPGKSCKCGEVCDPDNFQCPCDNCAKHHGGWFDCLFGKHARPRTLWSPSCEAEIHTRTKLIKYQVPKQVPTYKWVVEYCCDKCECTLTQSDSPIPATDTMPEKKSAPSADSVPPKTLPGDAIPPAPLSRPAPLQTPRAARKPIEVGYEVRASDLPEVAPPVFMPEPVRLQRQPLSDSQIPWERLEK